MSSIKGRYQDAFSLNTLMIIINIGTPNTSVYEIIIIDLMERSGYEPHLIIMYRIGIREAS